MAHVQFSGAQGLMTVLYFGFLEVSYYLFVVQD